MKILKTGFVFFTMITLLILTGCNVFPQTTITSIEIDQSMILDEYDINSFDISSIDIIIHNSDGTSNTIPLSTTYLSSSDLALLNQPGVHTITITYQNQTTQLTLTLIDASNLVFTVTFNGDGGVLVSGLETQSISYGQDAIPPVYEKQGYNFNGWTGTYSNITNNMILTAKWVIKTYIVTFDGSGGNLIDGQEVQFITHGGEAQAPIYVLDGYVLSGWSNSFDVVTEDITIVAIWSLPGPVYTLKDNDTYEFTTHTGDPYQLYIPDMYENKRVTSIAANALKDKTNLEMLSMGINIREIGDYAFANCSKLKEIYISAGGPVTINENAFDGIDSFFRFYVLSNLKSYFKTHLPTLTNHVLTHPGMHLVTFDANGGDLVDGEDVQFIVHGGTVYFPTYTRDGYYLYWEDSAVIYEDKIIKAQWSNIPPSTSGTSFILKEDGTYELERYRGTATDILVSSHHQGIPITSIGQSAFSHKAITSITISEGITHIQSNAFSNCTSLETVNLPNSLSQVDKYAFDNCLWYQNLPDGITVIGETLYGYKGNMPNNTELIIPIGVKYITFSAFNNETNLISITLPDGLIDIGSEAFYDCTNLATISFPSTLTNIQFQAFNNTAWFNNQPDGFVYAGSVLLTYKGSIPYGTPVTIPNGIKGIADRALANQYNVDSITLPDGLLVIGFGAFANCGSLSSITIPNSVKYIGHNAFDYCRELTNITLPSQLSYLGYEAFANCTKLESIILPDLLKSIEFGTFSNCTSLTSITLGENILLIGERAFYEATSLSQIVFNNKLQRIKEGAFINTNIKNLILPESVLFIEDFGITNGYTETVYIGENVEYFGFNSVLTGFIVSPNNLFYTSTDGFLYSKDEKTLLSIPVGLSSNIVIHQGTEIIKTFAISNLTILENLSLPESVSIIEDHAITYNTNLQSINLLNPKPPLLIGTNFDVANDDWILYVPIGAKADYDYWSIEASRVQTILLSYVVFFDIQGGTLISGDIVQGVTHGQSAVAPIVEKANYFLTWDKSFDYITSTITVKAIWKLLINVHFDPFGGTLVSGELDQKVPHGSAAVAPVLELENFTFAGWYGEPFDNVQHEITLIALWEFSLFQWEMNDFEDGIIITGLQPGFQEEHLVIHDQYEFLKVTGIGINAFCNATFLKSVTIHKNIKDIEIGILDGCTSLEEISLPFKYGNNEYTNFNPMAYLGYYFGDSTQITYSIPQSLKKVTIAEGITKIPSMMFQNSYHLEEIILPEGITHIDAYAFYNCHALVSVSIPTTVEQIGNGAFHYCHNLQNVILPNSLKTIGHDAFIGNTSLTSIIIPNQVVSIGDFAFKGCSNLEEITLSNQLVSVGEEAFRDCNKLSAITLPDSLQTIKKYAFFNCTGLQTIHIPQNLITLQDSVFEGCINLSSITVHNQNTNFIAIDDGLYSIDITKLYRVAHKKVGIYTLPSTVTSLSDGAFSDCTSITDVTLPNAIKIIPVNAFKNCINLKTVNIPTSCLQIDHYAFYNCSSLLELTFPENLGSLGRYALAECINLEKIYSTKQSPPSVEQYSLQNINPNLTIYIPQAYYETYLAYPAWRNFNYVFITP